MHRQLATTDEPVLSQVRAADFSDSDSGRVTVVVTATVPALGTVVNLLMRALL
jgi:hypothetical protein